MSVWDSYNTRIENYGGTKRGAIKRRESRYIHNRLPDNLSYQLVTMFDSAHTYNIESTEMQKASFEQNVAIINSDNLNEKYIYSLPGEDIEAGSIIHWMDNYWLVDERDANTTLYTRAKLLQCNYLLRWVNKNDEICEQWCMIEDGTKYLTGEFEDRHFVVTRGDTRVYMTISRNDQTKLLGRENRFILDDQESPFRMTYSLTKPLKLGWTYNNKGIYKFVLQEVQTTDDDNVELGIADYYKHFPRETNDDDDTSGDGNNGNFSGNGRKVWL